MKKFKFALIFICISCLLIGCNENASSKATSMAQDNSYTEKSPQANAELIDLHKNAIGDIKLAQTENGLYLIEECLSNRDFFTIKYIDFASKASSILCARPECAHNSDTCNGCIPSKFGGACGFTIDDKLYFLFRGNATKQTASRLISMNLDGANHQTLLEFNSATEVSAPIITDKANLYFIVKSFKSTDDGIETISQLVSVPLENSKLEIITTMENDAIICGANDGNILLKIPENYDTAGTGFYVPGNGNSYNISQVSTDGKRQNVLFQVNDKDQIGAMVNNKFYYVNTAEDKFYVKNLDGTEEFICDMPDFLNGSIYIYGLYDDKIIIDGSTKENDVVKTNRLYIDLTEKTVNTIKSKMSVDGVKSNKNIQILGDSSTSLVTISNIQTSEIDAPDKDGVIKKFTIHEPQYTIISKKDFFGGNDLFENIQEIK